MEQELVIQVTVLAFVSLELSADVLVVFLLVQAVQVMIVAYVECVFWDLVELIVVVVLMVEGFEVFLV